MHMTQNPTIYSSSISIRHWEIPNSKMHKNSKHTLRNERMISENKLTRNEPFDGAEPSPYSEKQFVVSSKVLRRSPLVQDVKKGLKERRLRKFRENGGLEI